MNDRLWYEQADRYGKWVVFTDGSIHTWPEGEADHDDVIDGREYLGEGSISPDGSTRLRATTQRTDVVQLALARARVGVR